MVYATLVLTGAFPFTYRGVAVSSLYRTTSKRAGDGLSGRHVSLHSPTDSSAAILLDSSSGWTAASLH